MSIERDKDNEIIDIRGILEEYLSKWYLFVICIIVCGALAYVYSKSRQASYDVRANVLISQDEEKGGASGLMANFGNLAGVFGSKGKVDDEVFVVKSHSVLRDAIKSLGTNKKHYVKPNILLTQFKYDDYPVDVYCNPAIADTLMTTITFNVKVNEKGKVDCKTVVRGEVVSEIKDGSFPLTVNIPLGRYVLNKTKNFEPGKPLKTIITYAGYNVAAESLSKEVEIFIADKKANVVALQTVSTSTAYAKDILNAIIANYNDRGVRERNLKSNKTAEFIDSRLALLTDDLTDTERGIEQFKKEQGMTDMVADVTYNLGKKSAIEQELVKAETQVEVTKMLLDFIDDPAHAYSLMPSTSATSDVQDAITSYNSVVLQRMDVARNARGNNVQLQKVDEQLAAMRVAMQASLEKAYRAAQIAVRDLKAEVSASQSRLGQMPYQERIYRSIMRQQELKEQLYLFLLQRREETSMTLANAVPMGVIVDEAYSISEPRGMSKKMVILMGIIFGFVLAPLIIYVKRTLRNRFETKDELEKLTDIPLLGEVCTSRQGKSLVVTPHSVSSVVELIRLIRTNLDFMTDDSDKVILMTSTVSGEGKSFVSINLAASFALLKKRVVLVGMDIRAPKLAEYLPISPRFGLTEYLSSDKVSLDDIIMRDAVAENLDIITAGPVPPNPGEMLLSKKVDSLFAELRSRYDYIIVDSAPVGMVSDTFSLARIADTTVYVCRANYTTFRDVKFFNDLYSEKRLPKMGLVVNGTAARKGYGYGYGRQEEEETKRWFQFWKKK